MQQEPILILSDNQQIEILFQQRLKEDNEKHFRMLSKSQQIHEYYVSKLEGRTKEQKETLCCKKIIDYFKEQCDVDLTQNFEEKFTPDYEEEDLVFEENAVVVYGVDFMSTARVVRYFRYFEPNIEWIDDSSCKVTFDSRERVEKMIREYEKKREEVEEKEKEAKENNSILQEVNLIVQEQREIKEAPKMQEEGINLRKWYELRGYIELGIERKIEVRVATNKDKIKVQEEGDKAKSKFAVYDFKKKKFVEDIEAEIREIYRINKFRGQRRRRPSDHNRQRGARRDGRDENYKERRWDRERGDRGDRDRGYRGDRRERGDRRDRFHNDRNRNQQDWDKQSNYSFDIRQRQRQQNQSIQHESQLHNLSFQKQNPALNISVESNANHSRCNYSFARDQKIKEESEQINVNLSFIREEGDIDNLLQGMNNLNLSFTKVAVQREESIIIIDDD